MAEVALGKYLDGFRIGAVRVPADADALVNELQAADKAALVHVPIVPTDDGWTPVMADLGYVNQEFGAGAASHPMFVKDDKIPDNARGIFLHPEHARRFRNLLQKADTRGRVWPCYWCRGVWVVSEQPARGGQQ